MTITVSLGDYMPKQLAAAFGALRAWCRNLPEDANVTWEDGVGTLTLEWVR